MVFVSHRGVLLPGLGSLRRTVFVLEEYRPGTSRASLLIGKHLGRRFIDFSLLLKHAIGFTCLYIGRVNSIVPSVL